MRKIAVFVTHRAPYGRLKAVLNAIKKHSELKLQVIVGTHASTESFFEYVRYSSFKELKRTFVDRLSAFIKYRLGITNIQDIDHLAKTIVADGFSIDATLPVFLAGGDLERMIYSQSLALSKMPGILRTLQPDIVLVNADRFEMLPIAVAAAEMNIIVAHVQGGDVSGTIDESVRHAISKLSHLHFPTTEKSKQRLIRMGENPETVFMTGCPTIDALITTNLTITDELIARNGQGYGDSFDHTEPYILVMQHPVTTSYSKSAEQMRAVLEAVAQMRMPVLLLYPNIDGGSDESTKVVREFVDEKRFPRATVYKTFSPEDYYRVLAGAKVAVGNSSSFLREGSFLGIPAVIVGNRQANRERADNVVEVGFNVKEIQAAIQAQLQHGKFPPSDVYGDGKAAERIAEKLATVPMPDAQKLFVD